MIRVYGLTRDEEIWKFWSYKGEVLTTGMEEEFINFVYEFMRLWGIRRSKNPRNTRNKDI